MTIKIDGVELTTDQARQVAEAYAKQQEVPKLWQPDVVEWYSVVNTIGETERYRRDSRYDENVLDRYKDFPTKEQAEFADKLRLQANLIIKATVQVEMFEPNLDDSTHVKWYVVLNTNTGMYVPLSCCALRYGIAYLSTIENADKVCAILNTEIKK